MPTKQADDRTAVAPQASAAGTVTTLGWDNGDLQFVSNIMIAQLKASGGAVPPEGLHGVVWQDDRHELVLTLRAKDA